MRRSASVMALLSLIGAFPAYGQATQYAIAFKTAAGSPTPTGSFSYNPANAPNSFSNFLVMWDGLTFDFTSVANTAGAAQIFNNPICANGVTGAAATFYLLTQCPEAQWSATGAPASSIFAFMESDTGGANLFDLALKTTSLPTNAAAAQGTFVSSISPGVIYIADSQNNRIRMISVSGIITTVAGNGTGWYSGDGGPATSAELRGPFGVAVDSSWNIYIADALNNRIRKVNTSGIITTVAGNGVAGFAGDGGPATSAWLWNPTGVAVDRSGNLFIADQRNNRIRKVATNGTITTVAGDGSVGFGGDGGLAVNAGLYYPASVAVDAYGDFFIADSQNNRIRMVNNSGIITTVAGNGFPGYTCSSGAPATSTGLHNPTGVASYPAALHFVIADEYNNCVRVVSGSTDATTIGNGIGSYGGDGMPYKSPSVELNNPTGVAVDPSTSNIYIADYVNNRIRMVSGSSPYDITTVAGDGLAGYSGDGGPASSARLYNPSGVAVAPAPPPLLAPALAAAP